MKDIVKAIVKYHIRVGTEEAACGLLPAQGGEVQVDTCPSKAENSTEVAK